MRVLVACEFSGIVRDAFAALGHDAWSCDLIATERDGQHIQADVSKVLGWGWDLMVAHPPCTYLTRAGWHWVNKPDRATLPLMGQPRRRAAAEAAEFFMMLLGAPIACIAVENPKPICHVNLPAPTQMIQPWQHGHGEIKATCLWLKGLPKLYPTDIVEGREARIHRASPGPNRWKERSRTLPGIAAAMASQWTHQATACFSAPETRLQPVIQECAA
jgi:hypothetical protein